MKSLLTHKATARTLIANLRKKRIAEQERLLEKRRMANELRDMRNWVAVFEEEYELPGEVVEQLNTRLQRIAERLKNI